jgi:hypothetical protein
MYRKLFAFALVIGTVGCSSNTIVPAPVVKDTGWVKVVKYDYTYHKTLLFPDGTEREFYHCAIVGALEEEGSVRIHYTGDGSSMASCATNVTVEVDPKTTNSQGKSITIGTTTIMGDSDEKETIWLKPDGSSCGHVRADRDTKRWVAYAFEDYSNNHYFSSKADAVKWLTENWCKP